jgi:hypothetical protein
MQTISRKMPILQLGYKRAGMSKSSYSTSKMEIQDAKSENSAMHQYILASLIMPFFRKLLVCNSAGIAV